MVVFKLIVPFVRNVVPAKAGIQRYLNWIPAFAGTTLLCYITNMAYNFKHLVIKRLLAENLLLILLQMMGMKFCVLSNPSLPIDFAAGAAAAFIFMRGYTILPGIWLGSLFASLLSGWTFVAGGVIASAYTLQTAMLFFLCLRFISPGLVFLDKKLFLRFVLLCFFLGLCFSPILPWQANVAGLLIMTLAITNWDMYFPEMSQWYQLPDFTSITILFFIALLINLAFSLGYFNSMNNIALLLTFLSVMIIISGIHRANMK